MRNFLLFLALITAFALPTSAADYAIPKNKAADAFDIKSYVVDGNDVVAVAKVASEAVEYARNGAPVFIEALTYRQRGHVGPDDNIQGTHTDIRPPEELRDWMKKDPIEKLKKYILTNNYLSDNKLREISEEVRAQVSIAHSWGKDQLKPVKGDLCANVFKA